ncbi:Transcription factor bHLH68 [Heracleum sosnowskyi]|uniref:Transcription factor bHLH68 n=1 Tax=Heracleum sosnowskyi TaxID=360622 RepID=A0AAD8I1V8_9APIA|nr:Transcription factor bHLH68 [Heracleum sosnowskyi]
MNRGVLQSSPVQQVMAAAPQYAPPWHDNSHEVPESWSLQLLMGGLVDEEDKSGISHLQQVLKLDKWEEQLLHHHQQQQASPIGSINSIHNDIKQENSSNSYHVFGSNHINPEFRAAAEPTWPQMMPVSSPKSCVTSLGSNMLDFSNNKADGRQLPDRSSESINTSIGGAVRKEKLGDRITALHQLVSPFGKTDTASVLLEAIGYIRFLQSQIEALSLPYLGSGSGNNMRQQHQHSVQGEKNCLFPDDPGQLLNDNNCLKRKAAPDQQESNEEAKKDLKSRGLCLVPVSCTLQVESDNGADYWGPAALGGGGGFH